MPKVLLLLEAGAERAHEQRDARTKPVAKRKTQVKTSPRIRLSITDTVVTSIGVDVRIVLVFRHAPRFRGRPGGAPLKSGPLPPIGTSMVLLRKVDSALSLGRILPGVAHEVRNPLAFALSNVENLGEYVRDLTRVLVAYQKRLEEAGLRDAELRALEGEVDLDFLLEDAPGAVGEAVDGLRRVDELVEGLSRLAQAPDAGTPVPVAVHTVARQAAALLGKTLRGRAVVRVEGEGTAVARPQEVLKALVASVLEAADRHTGPGCMELRVRVAPDGEFAVETGGGLTSRTSTASCAALPG